MIYRRRGLLSVLEFLTKSITGDTLNFIGFFISTIVSLVLGLGIACVYMYKNNYNKSFVVTLALLPAMVQIVIMLVNGNLGAGVAVMGAFSLVRFRSIPGNSRDISSIFLSMAVGLATGMGYIFYAAVFLIIIGLSNIVLMYSSFGGEKNDCRTLKVTIPENLDYDGLFDDLFSEYTRSAELCRIKTTNMGSLIELTYKIRINTSVVPKKFIDDVRCRNGNLNITVSHQMEAKEEL